MRNYLTKIANAVVVGLISLVTAIGLTHDARGQITANWFSGMGNWNDMSMWDIGVVPHNSPPDFYNVVIDSNAGVNSIVRVVSTNNFVVDSISIDADDELVIEANSLVEVIRDGGRPASGVISNSGILTLDSTTGGGNSTLRLETPVTLSGGGTVNLVGNNTFVTDAISTPDGELLNLDNTISGSGFLGNGRLKLTNETLGLIHANVDGSKLTLGSRANVDSANQGVLQASLGGILQLNGNSNSKLLNSGGVIQALDNSSVDLANQVWITGGTIVGVGSGEIRVPSNNNVTIEDATIDQVHITNNSGLTLSGQINNGSLFINGKATGQSRVFIHTETTLDGNGMVNMSGLGARLIDFSANAGHLINANNTIQGQGVIGGGQMQLTNQSAGLIDANINGEVLDITTRNGVDLINDGILRSTNGGKLELRGFSGVVDNSNGQIIAGDDSTVEFTQSTLTIVGGTLLAEGSGQFSTRQFATAQLENLDLATPFLINGSSNLRLVGAIHNQVIDIDGSTATSNLIFNTDAALDGDNVINMIGPGARIITSAGAANDGRLTNVNNLIRGQGSLGVGRLELTNQANGVISADVNGATMSMQTESGEIVFNEGIIESRNGGTLQIYGFGADLDNSGGTIRVVDNSLLELKNNLVVSNGLLHSSGNGQILVPATQFVTFNDLTVEGAVNIEGVLTLTETLENNAHITFNSSGLLRVTPKPAILAGSGNLNLSDISSQVVGTTTNLGLEVVDSTVSGIGKFLVDTRFRGGAILAPGNSIGSIVFDGNRTNQFVDGATIEIEMDSISGSPGINWDFVDVVNGTLDFDDDVLPGNVTVKLVTLDANGEPGLLANFDSNSDFSIPIAQAHTVTGFVSTNFTVDLTEFANEASGTFCIALDESTEDTLLLNYFALLLGDLNGDCLVNLLDVDPFVAAITSGTYIPQADINQDGFVNLLDVAPFVLLLTGG